MAESVKPRLAVDLDEIERQLAHAHAAPAAPRNDPLAELARIVGQDDPFQSILTNDRSLGPKIRQRAETDGPFASANDREPQVAAVPELRGSYDPHGPTDLDAAYADRSDRYQGYPAQGEYAPDSFDQDDYPDPSEIEQAVREHAETAAPERRSRKPLLAAAAIVGAAVLGVGGAMMLRGPSALVGSGDPPLVKADTEPTKVQPQSPGGVEIPNQNKQIYERAGHESQTKVVNREEQPVDVRQATRTASADPAVVVPASASPPPAAQPPQGGLALGEPRKVRTISIRPDGTVILPDSAPSAPPKPAAANPVPQPAAATPADNPQSRAAATPTTPAARPAAATPPTSGGSSSQALATPPQPAPQPAPQRAAAPQPAPSVTPQPAAQPAPQRVASVQPTATPVAAPQPTEAVVGGFSVQLGVSQSETDAKATLQRLQAKYADLSGKPPLIRKAEVNGNTIYRVRVGPMSREEASSLCSKLQGQGGECYVAKN